DLLISALAAMAETSSDLLSDMRFPSSVTSCGGTRPTTRPHTASRSAGIRGERAFRRRVVGNFPLSEDTNLCTSLWTTTREAPPPARQAALSDDFRNPERSTGPVDARR